MKEKIWVVPDIHGEIEMFDYFWNHIVKDNSKVIQLGDMWNEKGKPNTLYALMYFYNLYHQQNKNKNKTLRIVRGNHENEWSIDWWMIKEREWNEQYEILKQKLPNKKWIQPSINEVRRWIQSLPPFIKEEKYFFVHGWYNPEWSISEHFEKDNYNDETLYWWEGIYLRNGFEWGSARKIYQYYENWCKKEKLNIDSEETKKRWLKEKQWHYYNYPTIASYNEKLKENNIVLFCGHQFNPFAKEKFEPLCLSNLYMLDGMIGYVGITMNWNNQQTIINEKMAMFNYAIIENEKIEINSISYADMLLKIKNKKD